MLHAICLPLLLCATPAAIDSVVAFVDVTVIPMDRERSLPHSTVLVRDGRIVAVGPSKEVRVPAGARTVNGRGNFLLPGLAEMHAHIPGGQAPDSVVERTLFLYVAGGITTIRGMLGHPDHLELRSRAARGELISPTIYTSGPSLNGNSVPTPAAARQAVADQKKAGYDFLKIHPGIEREVFDTLAATARRVGIRMAGHVPAEVGLRRALEVPYASIDHLDGYVEAMVPPRANVPESQMFGVNLGERLDQSLLPELVKATREAGVWNVPTQTLLENLAPPVSLEALARRPEMRYMSPETLADWAESKQSIMKETGSSPESVRRTMETRRRLIKALHDRGAGLLLGSDAPQIYNVPGFSIHRELESLVAAGLTPYEALATGTRNVAVFFGTLPRSGTVEVGKQADLILLTANPLEDIRNTTRRSGVMLRGRWFPQAELERRLAAIARSVGN
jgi:cytosine/adenosine deaminase-related metal-dependent hydrolase